MKNKYYLCSIIAITMHSMPQTSYAQSPGENYIVTETMLNETGTRSVKSVQYYDGLGRPSVLAAGGANTSGKYLYTMTEYDNMGRESKTWLPAVGTTSPSIITASTMSSKSNTTYQSDGYAFSETTYDALGRPTFRSTPGKLWKNKNKGIKTEYITNAADSVRKYTLDSSGNPSWTASYPAASLTGERVTDEDGHVIETYKDLLGNVVLERRKDGTANNDTYYVYEAGLLRTVIPPLYQSNSDNSILYKYEYDGYGRCKKKTLPGNIITTYYYDRSGRVIYMQDARLRSCGRHRFYMYDELGRLVVQGTVSSQTVPEGKNLFVRFSPTQSGICGTGYEYLATYISNTDIIGRHILIDSEQNTPSQPISEIDDSNESYCNYVQESQPISEIDDSNESYCNYVQEIDGALVELDNPQIEIVNYYDGYDFLNASLFKTALNGADFSKSGPACATTLQTGSIQSTSDGRYLCSVLYYDERGRVTDSRQTTVNGAVMSQTTTYSFTNQPLQTVTKLKMGYMVPTVTEANVYDTKSDKLTSTSLNFGNAAIPVASITYDDLGRVKTRNSHGGNIRTSYTYDLHGWLTELAATKANGSRLFQEDIHYADNSNSAINCYNGNISMVRWLSGDNPMGQDICNGYTYTYDGLNRLTKAAFGMCPVSVPGLSTNNDMGTVEYAYNPNSSITSLTRYGKKDVGYGIIDRLTYQYKGNQLKTITDTGSALHYDGAFEFSDANKAKLTQKVYDYDACGSMTYDPNRGITKIEYDLLGNPVRVQFCNGNVTEYVYSAAGARLQTTHKTAVSGISVAAGRTRTLTSKETLSSDLTYYMGNFIYTRDGLQYHFADGYTEGNGASYFHYYIRDHQGNNRVVAKYDGTIEQTTHYYPYGGILSQSTNQGVQKFKYNGKEFDTMHGLNMYDYGARQQDPAVGMFTSMDPLCEKYYNISPYSYCAGNPIRYVDVDGRFMWPWERKSLIRYSGNGRFNLNIDNLSGFSRNSFYVINNDSHNWKPGEIGLNTQIGKISMLEHQTFTSTHKPIGIEQTAIDVKTNNATSTGLPDRRYKSRSISSMSPVKGPKGAGAMLFLDMVITAFDQYSTFSSMWDMDALADQTNSLQSSFDAVNKYSSRIPIEYKNNVDIMGAIVNYVFQGINSTKNKDVVKIGNQILYNAGRYDKDKKEYQPFIRQ